MRIITLNVCGIRAAARKGLCGEFDREGFSDHAPLTMDYRL